MTPRRRNARAKSSPARRRRRPVPFIGAGDDLEQGDGVEVSGAPANHARLTGGDVDADWAGAEGGGEEAVGGSVATPDQDVVDEIARALGVEQPDGEELHVSGEILDRRDRFRWHLERDAEDEAEGRRHSRRGAV